MDKPSRTPGTDADLAHAPLHKVVEVEEVYDVVRGMNLTRRIRQRLTLECGHVVTRDFGGHPGLEVGSKCPCLVCYAEKVVG